MSSNCATSNTLLVRALAADEQAWQRLVHLYAPLVRHWCQQWGLHGPDDDDVAQDVFQVLSMNLAQFDSARQGATFRGWLRGITRNKLLEFQRRRGPSPAVGGTDVLIGLQQIPESIWATTQDPPNVMAELFHRALELVREEFEPKTWQAFCRAAVDGHAVADIASDLGVSTAAVRQAKSRVLRRLREEVGELID